MSKNIIHLESNKSKIIYNDDKFGEESYGYNKKYIPNNLMKSCILTKDSKEFGNRTIRPKKSFKTFKSINLTKIQ